MRYYSVLGFYLFLGITASVSAASAPPTVVKDEALAKTLSGAHAIRYRIMKNQYPGTLSVTYSDGIYLLSAKQTGGKNTATGSKSKFDIHGRILTITDKYIKFSGSIITQLSQDKTGRCENKGEFYFAPNRYTKTFTYWRLLQDRHKCSGKQTIVEFSIKRSDSDPAARLFNRYRKNIKGIGFISHNMRTDEHPLYILFPLNGATRLYDQPNGKQIALVTGRLFDESYQPAGITRRQYRSRAYVYSSLLIKREGAYARINTHPKDIFKTSSGKYVVKVFKRKNGFLKILPYTMHYPAWVSEKDLAKQNYQFSSWRDYILMNLDKTYQPAYAFGLAIRPTADSKSQPLAVLRGYKYTIKLTGRTHKQWMQVSVRKLSKQCRKTTTQWKGWIQAVDNKGAPNIRLRPRYGCR